MNLFVRTVASVKGGDSGLSQSVVAEDALALWLKQPENLAAIRKMNLAEMAEQQGLEVPEDFLALLKEDA